MNRSADNDHTRDNSDSNGAERVLLWPESIRSSDEGFVLGWMEQTGCCQRVIVAGIIEAHPDRDFEQQVKSMRNNLRQLMPCHCCSCTLSSVDTKKREFCAGCTRKPLDGLDVVAYYKPSEPEKLPNILPIVSDSSGYPFWVDKSTNFTAEQLVLYPDRGRGNGFLMFRPTNISEDSSSSRMYMRMEYASTLMKGMRRVAQLRSANEDFAALQRRSLPPSKQPANTMISTHSFLLRHSLLGRHLSNGLNGLPVIGLFRYGLSLMRSKENASEHAGCAVCRKPTIIPVTHYKEAACRIAQSNMILQLLVDMCFGFILGRVAVHLLSDTTGVQQVAHRYFDLLQQAMDWLNSFPVGFKLNERLTAALSHQVSSWLDVHKVLVDGVMSCLGLLARRGVGQALGICLGGRSLLALLYDVLQIGLLHVTLLAAFFGRIYQGELSVLDTLWCLFRGKKRNVLRRRTDTMDYDSTQLLFGTVLFVVALFMFTTVLVYHVFFAACYLAAAIGLSTVRGPCIFIENFPFGMLTYRATTDWFIEQVFLEVDEARSDDSVDVTYLRKRATSYTSIVWDELSSPLRSIASHMYITMSSLLIGPPRGGWTMR